MTDHEDEAALARRAAAGDRAAQHEVVERVLDRLAAAIRCLLPGDPGADDCLQDAVVEVLRSCGSFRGESALETWAGRIAARVAMRRLREKRRELRVVAPVEQPDVPGEAPRGDDELARRRVWERLEAALAQLNPGQRAAIVMGLVLGYTAEEIAEITHSRFSTVRDRIALGRRLLRQRLLDDPELVEFLEKGARR
jgi:RNA polymerase sigma-70 factor, ECF subfamily